MGFGTSDILSVLGDEVVLVHGEPIASVAGGVSLDSEAAEGGLAFCSDRSKEAPGRIARSGATVIICHARAVECLADKGLQKTLIAVANPRLAYIRVMNKLYPPDSEVGVDVTAKIHSTADIGAGVYVGPQSVIDADCRIGEATVIESHVRLHRGTCIGKRVRICAGAVIGAAGFGFERAPDGKLHRFPQRGHVEIGDDVEIGANVCIDRAAQDVTRIGAGTKIDDLAYIAHNVRIGEDCLIMASSIVAGSCVIGDRVEISPGAIVRDKTVIGEDARIGLGAVVVSDLVAGITVAGVPAKPMTDRDGTSGKGR
ncbi:MAG: UDP-3-O-(3-hydroxymyristoyl)glucosamine N-acyltransferase [Lysobacterales bacterium]|nr:MAG: UDP-3-O-(3-hydroxymyristoyl)glucosamine N-acyltransferase [Xanthomonadales bacterium]